MKHSTSTCACACACTCTCTCTWHSLCFHQRTGPTFLCTHHIEPVDIALRGPHPPNQEAGGRILKQYRVGSFSLSLYIPCVPVSQRHSVCDLCALQDVSQWLLCCVDDDKTDETKTYNEPRHIIIGKNKGFDSLLCKDSSPILVSLVPFSLLLSPLQFDDKCVLEDHCLMWMLKANGRVEREGEEGGVWGWHVRGRGEKTTTYHRCISHQFSYTSACMHWQSCMCVCVCVWGK